MNRFQAVLKQSIIFGSFFLYPAVTTFGNTGGVTIVEVLAAVTLVFVWPAALKTRLIIPLLAWVVVSLLSAIANTASAYDASTLAAKSIAIFLLAFAPALAIAALSRSSVRSAAADVGVMRAISIAVLVHAAIGFMQYQAFQGGGGLPLISLFHNPSFADLQAVQTDYALYVKRPFGFFPEPSAMAACLGPFLLLQVDRALTDPRDRWLNWLSFLAGSGLMIISASVFNLVYWPLVLVAILRRRGLSVRLVELAALPVMAAVFIVVAGKVNRNILDVGANTSAQGRLASLADGWSLFAGDFHSLFVGSGPGSSVLALRSSGYASPAIYSISVVQLAELGLLALIIWAAFGRAMRFGVRESWPAIVAWVFGLSVATGYVALVPLWVFVALVSDGSARTEPSRDGDSALDPPSSLEGASSGSPHPSAVRTLEVDGRRGPIERRPSVP